MKIRAVRRAAIASIAATMFLAPHARAQSSTTGGAAGQPHDRENGRLFQQFITDAAIMNKQWYSVEVRLQRGAVPPIESADGFLLTPVTAISPMKNLEVGGKVSYIDFNLNDDLNGHSGESGIGDLTVWGKYRFLEGPVSASGGILLDLPTGSHNDGLGTGKLVPALFGAIRARAGEGSIIGSLGVRFNHDATMLDVRNRANTSTFLGGGYIWEPLEDLGVSGEVTVESERFKDTSSDIRATAGAQWYGISHSVLRGGISIGLSDGAPDFELILGYAYTF